MYTIAPTQTGNSSEGLERRHCPRHQVKSLAYLDIGTDNGGIVLNICENGLAVHAVNALPPDPRVDIRIRLPRSMKRLEIKAKLAWISITRKEAGVEFLDLPEEIRLEIKEWLATDNVEPIYCESYRSSESQAASRLPRKDKWTSLVSELTSIPAGIDRVGQSSLAEGCITSDNGASSLAETVATATPSCELATSPLEKGSVTSDKELVNLASPAELAVSKTLMAEEKKREIMPEFTIAESEEPSIKRIAGIIDVGDPSDRKNDPDFSLPTENPLNTPLRPVVVPSNRSNGATNGLRTFREGPSSAVNHSDFLKKARPLFEPNNVTSRETEPLDSVVLQLAQSPADETAPALASPAEPKYSVPPPMSDLIATSSPVTEPGIPSPLHAVSAIALHSATVPDSENSRPLQSASSRSLDLPRFLRIFALCVLLSAVCLTVGIIVGRNAATRSLNITSSHNELPTQSSPQNAGVGKNVSPLSQPLASTLGLRTQGATDDKRRSAHAQKSDAQLPSRVDERSIETLTPHSAAADRAGNETETQSTHDQGPDASGIPEGGDSTVRVMPFGPATSKSSSAPSFAPAATIHTAPSPDSSTAQHLQPNSDRLVAAYPIYRVQPIYPRAAIQQGIEGTVKIHVTIAPDGAVKNLKVVSGPPVLSPAAVDAAQYWRYIPALRNGEPIETETDINIEFHRPH